MLLLEAIGLYKTIRDQPVLRGINFSIKAGEKLAIAGATGSGKSSLLKIIGGLMQADAGEAKFKGKRILGPDEKLIPGHPSIAYLSQHFELRNNYRVEELLDMANKKSTLDLDAITEICRVAHLLKRRTDQLSGGEKQRIATARLLLSAPELLLLDEPYSNLDPAHRKTMKEMIRNLSTTENITCILVSHDPADCLSWADRMLVLNDGEVVQDAIPEELYHKPLNEYVAGLLGPYVYVDARLAVETGLCQAQTHTASIFTRPEYFSVVTDGRGAPVRVTDIRFAGDHLDVDILWSGNSITIYQPHRPNFQVGDMIGLVLDLSLQR